jgi:hypothetical protein
MAAVGYGFFLAGTHYPFFLPSFEGITLFRPLSAGTPPQTFYLARSLKLAQNSVHYGFDIGN